MERLVRGAEALGLTLTPAQLNAFDVYWAEMASWNAKINLTTIIDRDEVQTRHFLDSLTVLLALSPSPGVSASCDGSDTLLDVGAGAGLPGIPLRIACPDLSVTLLEATTKKATFLRHTLDRLNASDVVVIDGRAEEVGHSPQYRESFDIVVARAVARLASLSELCLPFVKIGGRFIAMKAIDIREEVEEAQSAISLLGGHLNEIREVEVPGLLSRRSLVIVDKTRPTPSKYPRRPGLPVKRPL